MSKYMYNHYLPDPRAQLNLIDRCKYGKVNITELEQLTTNKNIMNYTVPLMHLCENYFVNLECIKFLVEKGALVNGMSISGKPFNYTTSLLCYVKNRIDIDIDIVKYLLQKGTDVNRIDENNKTVLTYLCEKYIDFACIDLLLEYNANISSTNNDYVDPLIIICSKKNPSFDEIKYFVDHKANVNCINIDDNGETPLTILCKHKKTVREGIKYLVTHGADVNHTNFKSETPLGILCLGKKYQHLNIIKFLLEHGANINILDSNADTPLMISRKKMDNFTFNEFKFYVDNGADITISNSRRETILSTFPADPTLFRTCIQYVIKNYSKYNEYVLCEYCKLGDISANDIEFMINNFTNMLDVCTKILQYLCKYNQSCSVQCMEYLVSHGADVNSCDNDLTPLHKLCLCEHINLSNVQYLIDNGADVNKIINSRTLLETLCSSSYVTPIIIKVLVDGGAHVNTDGLTKPPLLSLCQNKRNYDMRYNALKCIQNISQCMGRLITEGADVNNIFDDESPLDAVCKNDTLDQLSKIYCLVKHGANVNRKKLQTEHLPDEVIWTVPLSYLCDNFENKSLTHVFFEKISKCIDVLLEHGADTTLLSKRHVELLQKRGKMQLKRKTSESCIVGYEKIEPGEKYILCRSAGKHILKYSNYQKINNKKTCLVCNTLLDPLQIYINE